MKTISLFDTKLNKRENDEKKNDELVCGNLCLHIGFACR